MRYRIRYCQGSSGCLIREQFAETLEQAIFLAVLAEESQKVWISEFSSACGDYICKMVRTNRHVQPEGHGLKDVMPRLAFV